VKNEAAKDPETKKLDALKRKVQDIKIKIKEIEGTPPTLSGMSKEEMIAVYQKDLSAAEEALHKEEQLQSNKSVQDL